MRPFLLSGVLWITLTSAFWYAATTSLTDATRADCKLGIQKACTQLIHDGVKP